MADTTDFLLAQTEESWAQARQSEDQRATISNLLIIIASAIHGVLTQTGFTKSALPLRDLAWEGLHIWKVENGGCQLP